MKSAFLFLLLCGCTSRILHAQSQTKLNRTQCESLNLEQRKLDGLYNKILNAAEYKGNPDFVKAFAKSQQAWGPYRDSVIEARFPGQDKKGIWGSAYEMCRCTLLVELTKSRIAEIEVWDRGIGEGDVCTGSVKTR